MLRLTDDRYSERFTVSGTGVSGGRPDFLAEQGVAYPHEGWEQGLAAEGGGGQGGSSSGQGATEGPAADVLRSGSEPTGPLDLPGQSPLFHAQQASRYDRQMLIKAYQQKFGCRLVVMSDTIFPDCVVLFEELVYNASPVQDLHLILNSPGGDGETAIRLVRSAQARCRDLTIIVPVQAKSAATLLAIGAHRILMGPTSDLRPVDPQFRLGDGLVSAKDLIQAVDRAMEQVAENPDTYPLHAALLADVNAVMLQQARSALARTEDLVGDALRSNPARSLADVDALRQSLRAPLIDIPKSHAAVFGAEDAIAAGLPVQNLDPRSWQWQLIWRLWMKYEVLPPSSVYEGEHSSQILLHRQSG